MKFHADTRIRATAKLVGFYALLVMGSVLLWSLLKIGYQSQIALLSLPWLVIACLAAQTPTYKHRPFVAKYAHVVVWLSFGVLLCVLAVGTPFINSVEKQASPPIKSSSKT